MHPTILKQELAEIKADVIIEATIELTAIKQRDVTMEEVAAYIRMNDLG